MLSVTTGYGLLIFLPAHAIISTLLIFFLVRHERENLQRRATREGLRVNAQGPERTLTFFQFGVPSLVFWPFIFCFKKWKYIMTFFGASLLENAVYCLLWFYMKQPHHLHKTNEIIAAMSLMLAGILLLILYRAFKPEGTDIVALSRLREQNTHEYGIFFDFFKAVRILPDTSEVAVRRAQLANLRPDL